VLVDVDSVTPLALLDFGFLTTSADPLFDATIATLIYDMYSPRAKAARESLYGMHVEAWGQRFETARCSTRSTRCAVLPRP